MLRAVEDVQVDFVALRLEGGTTVTVAADHLVLAQEGSVNVSDLAVPTHKHLVRSGDVRPGWRVWTVGDTPAGACTATVCTATAKEVLLVRRRRLSGMFHPLVLDTGTIVVNGAVAADGGREWAVGYPAHTLVLAPVRGLYRLTPPVGLQFLSSVLQRLALFPVFGMVVGGVANCIATMGAVGVLQSI